MSEPKSARAQALDGDAPGEEIKGGIEVAYSPKRGKIVFLVHLDDYCASMQVSTEAAEAFARDIHHAIRMARGHLQ